MLFLNSIIILQILGALLCAISFFVFISSFKTPLYEEAIDVDWSDDKGVNILLEEEQEPLRTELSEKENEKTYSEDIDNNNFDNDTIIKPNFITRMFTGAILKVKKPIEKQVEISTNTEEALPINEDKFNTFNQEHVNEEEEFDWNIEELSLQFPNQLEKEENVDEETYEYFPHEQNGITIFSKENITDAEIGDLKELISTIKEEFNNEKVININAFLEEECFEIDKDIMKFNLGNFKSSSMKY